MSLSLSRERTIGIALESTRNTPNNTATVFPIVHNYEVNPVNEYYEDRGIAGVRSNLLKKELAMQSCEGMIEDSLDVNGIIGYALSSLMSAPTTNQDGSSNGYSHVWTAFTANPQTLTIHSDDKLEGLKRAHGVQVKSVEIDIKRTETLVKVEFVGVGISAGSAQTSVITKKVNDLLARHVVAKYADTSAGLAGANGFFVSECNIKLTNNLELDDSYGKTRTLDAADTIPGVPLVEMTMKGKVRDAVWYQSNLNNSQKAFSIDMELPSVITGSTLKPRFYFELPPSNIVASGEKDKDSEMRFELSIESNYSLADNRHCQIILQNEITTYTA